jgi:hypothetical protein
MHVVSLIENIEDTSQNSELILEMCKCDLLFS